MSSAGTSKRGRGKRGAAQSRGLVPNLITSGPGANGPVVEELTKVSALLFPGVNYLEELDPKDQKSWIRFREAVSRGHHSVAELVKTISDVMRRQSDAAIEDQKERRDASHENQKERRAAELEERERRFALELEDLQQQREERKARLDQELRERNLLLAMIALGFLCTIALVVVGVVAEQHVALGLSALGGLFSAAGVNRLFVFGSATPAAPQAEERG